MAVGLTVNEAGLAMGFNRSLENLQSQAQHVVNRQDATIEALRAKVRRLESELADERSRRKTAEFRLARSRFN